MSRHLFDKEDENDRYDKQLQRLASFSECDEGRHENFSTY
jgi:hypothetical protein